MQIFKQIVHCSLIFLFSCITAMGQNNWYRGNTHIHTTYSDGSLIPADVVSAYKAAGYSFLFITDENIITPTDTLSDSTFLCLNGEEAILYQHVSCLYIQQPVTPVTFRQVVDSTNAQGGFAVLNHPLRGNHWVYCKDILEMDSLKFIEIFNGKSEKDGYYDNQMLWDSVLSAGKLVYGVAADDFHEMKHISKGWIVVSAGSLHKDSIVNAIKQGDFYSSTGVTIFELNIVDSTIFIKTTNAIRIFFTGNNRDTLQISDGDSASYRINGNEGYVRVTAINNAGRKAWTQPLFWNKVYEGNPYIGLKPLEAENYEWQVFPNPTNGLITIQTARIEEGLCFRIHDVTGKIVESGKMNSTTLITINLEKYSKGIYFIRLANKTTNKTYKVFVR